MKEELLPETVEIICIDCKETKQVPYSIHPQYRCNDCAGKGIRAMTPAEFAESVQDNCNTCGGSGFASELYGGYDGVCSDCGGVGKQQKR